MDFRLDLCYFFDLLQVKRGYRFEEYIRDYTEYILGKGFDNDY